MKPTVRNNELKTDALETMRHTKKTMETGFLSPYSHVIVHSKFKCRASHLSYGLRQRVVWLAVTCATYQSS